MKRLIFTLIILANCTMLLAQSTESDTHKHRLIEFVNNGDFSKAAEEVKLVENWKFDIHDKRDFFDIDQAFNFYKFMYAIDIDSGVRDSFLFYLSKECDVYLAYYNRNGDYQNAINYATLAHAIKKSVLGEQHPLYATSLNNLGNLYSEMGDYSNAETYYLQALEIRKSILGELHPDYATSLTNLGNLYKDMGEYSKAEPYYLQALEIRKTIFGENHPDYATSLNNLGALYKDKGDYSKAEVFHLQALEIKKSVYDEQHPDYAASLNNLGVLYKDMGNYSKAETYYLRALAIMKSVLGEQHPDYAASLNNLGVLYKDMGNYSKAETYYLRALAIMKSVLGEQHPDYAASLNNLGHVYQDMGNYSKAETYYLQALEIMKSVLSEQHHSYATSLNNLGSLYAHMGDYLKAETYHMQALEIRKSVLGELHPDYATSLNNLGSLYVHMGDYLKAETYYLQALKIIKSVLGEQHPLYATSLNNLSALYKEKGDYSKAETYYLQALEIIKSVLGEQHPLYATSLNNLGNLYSEIGDYSKAETYYLQALKIIKFISGEKHPHYATSLNNLGVLYKKMGSYSNAETYYLQALEIRKSVLGELHPDYATSLNNLGSLYSEIGDFLKAETYYLQALEIRKSVLGELHPDYATSLNNLGALYKDKGDYSKAETYYLQALEIIKSVLGEQHPLYATSLNNLGTLYKEKGDYSKAEIYYLQASQIQKNNFITSLDFMTEQQRRHYWNTMHPSFGNTYPNFSYISYTKTLSISTFAYDNELFTKGLLLNSSNTITHSIQSSADTTLINKFNQLKSTKQVILHLQETEPQSSYIGNYIERAEQLEKEITKSSAAYRENLRQWSITWDSVKAVLKPNQVAIEYMTAPLSKDSTMYCALLLRDTCSYPILIPLFEQKEILKLLNTSDSTHINTTYAFKHNGKQLSQYIWSKVTPYLNKGENVFFSPTGILHQIAIENLPYDSNQTMADVYNLVRLSSTRELVMHKEPITHQIATVYGGVNYGTTPDKMYAYSRKYRDIRRDGADELPGTKVELDSIVPILQAKGIKVNVYTKDTANEESFKALSGTQQHIIHIGTHGFYWSDSTAQQQAYFKQYDIMMNDGDDDTIRSHPYADPLNRCGLLFAGANTALQGYSDRLETGVQDGILTAKEISLLDLRGADIVVLSACETGLGDITGEGVFGLQRGLKMAGVQTILMSLWKVHDDATRLLMTSFYRNYVSGLSKREAFYKAQQEVRNYTGNTSSTDNRSAAQDKFMKKSNKSGVSAPSVNKSQTNVGNKNKHPYADPYYWAGFILLD